MPNASLYVRLSKMAGDTNLSLEGMLDDVRALAAKLGADVYDEHVDDGISGAVRDRPEFTAWLEDGRSGAVDFLLTPHADRLTREGVNAAALVLDTVEGKDPLSGKVVRDPVRLMDCTGLDSFDTDSFRWRFVIAAEVARAERERIKARNINTRRRLLRAGRFTGGTVPFGTKVVPAEEGGKQLVRCDEEANLLRQAAGMLLDDEPMRSTVRWLNAQGSRTRRGLEWQRSSLRATLLSAPSREFVFDLATHDALRERLKRSDDERKPTAGRPQTSLLVGGGGVCRSCGRKVTTSAGRYVCGSIASGEFCPAPVTIKISAVDDWIEDEYLRVYGRMEYLAPQIVVTGGDDLEEAARAVEVAQQALLEDPGAEALEAYTEAKARLKKAHESPRKRERVLVATGKTIGQLWAESDVPARAALLGDALDGPIEILRNPGGKARGRRPVDLQGRLRVPWREGGNDIEIE